MDLQQIKEEIVPDVHIKEESVSEDEAPMLTSFQLPDLNIKDEPIKEEQLSTPELFPPFQIKSESSSDDNKLNVEYESFASHENEQLIENHLDKHVLQHSDPLSNSTIKNENQQQTFTTIRTEVPVDLTAIFKSNCVPPHDYELDPVTKKPNRKTLVQRKYDQWNFCGKCLTNFITSTSLKGHTCLPKSQRNLELPYRCHKCDKSFQYRSSLYSHVTVTTHPEYSLRFTCKTCNKSFAREVNLNNHLRYHTDEHLYYCNTCSTSFASIQFVEEHFKETFHSVVQPYESCDVCDAELAIQNDTLKSAFANLSYLCSVCNITFQCKCKFHDHNVRLHRPSGPNFVCNIGLCRISYPEEWQLEVHKQSIHNKRKQLLKVNKGRTYNSKKTYSRLVNAKKQVPRSEQLLTVNKRTYNSKKTYSKLVNAKKQLPRSEQKLLTVNKERTLYNIKKTYSRLVNAKKQLVKNMVHSETTSEMLFKQ